MKSSLRSWICPSAEVDLYWLSFLYGWFGFLLWYIDPTKIYALNLSAKNLAGINGPFSWGFAVSIFGLQKCGIGTKCRKDERSNEQEVENWFIGNSPFFKNRVLTLLLFAIWPDEKLWREWSIFSRLVELIWIFSMLSVIWKYNRCVRKHQVHQLRIGLQLNRRDLHDPFRPWLNKCKCDLISTILPFRMQQSYIIAVQCSILDSIWLKTEDWRLKTKKLKTRDKTVKTEVWKRTLKNENWKLNAEDWRLKAENWRQKTEFWKTED